VTHTRQIREDSQRAPAATGRPSQAAQVDLIQVRGILFRPNQHNGTSSNPCDPIQQRSEVIRRFKVKKQRFHLSFTSV
jgi:hypothetical protein